MLTRTELESLAKKCIEISDESADEDGFVSVSRLAARFGAGVVMRPLLVEGMLASVEPSPTQTEMRVKSLPWAVLVDSETYSGITEENLEAETSAAPLPHRLRNTVAHELIHSFAFRAKDFGVELTKSRDPRVSRKEYVERIERETEKLSPLLLLPGKFLNAYFSRERASVSTEDLTEIRRRMGVSRYVLVNRLNLLRFGNGREILDRPCLCNVAIGVGEWVSGKEARLKDWPLFVNFSRNLVPDFLHDLVGKKPLTAREVFKDPASWLRGGDQLEIRMTVGAGTPRTPNAENMNISVSVEPVSPKKEASFFFVVRTLLG